MVKNYAVITGTLCEDPREYSFAELPAELPSKCIDEPLIQMSLTVWYGGVTSQFLLICVPLFIIDIKQIKQNTVTIITTEVFQANTTQSHVYQI